MNREEMMTSHESQSNHFGFETIKNRKGGENK
jgi:hypothetical protein